ncbi:MAG: aminotransferase class IV [Bacteroidota bacterium]
MCLLFETISIQGGVAENLPWHQDRVDASIRALFGKRPDFSLAEIIRVPPEARLGHFRCRIDYNTDIEKTEFQPYHLKEINSLRMVEDNEIEYPYKFNNRDRLDKLTGLRGDAGDILIVRNGFITDTSTANIIFNDGRRWLTPAMPLLAGTCRARLLDLGIIHEAKIKSSDLHLFLEAKLINAMRKPENSSAVPIEKISY